MQSRRQEARQKAIRQEFYQSDRVRNFHRALLHSETLQAHADQVKTERRVAAAANMETKKMIDDIKQRWLEDIEQERQHLRRREMDAKAVGDFVKEQMMENERIRQQIQREKEREIEECRKLHEQYAREQQMRKRQDQIDKMKARKAYWDLLAAKRDIQAQEAKQQEMAEQRRRFFEMERDKVLMSKLERKEEKRRVAQKYKERVAEQAATRMHEKARKEEALNAKIMADCKAKWEAKMKQEETEQEEKRKSMLDAIEVHRKLMEREKEEKLKEEEQRAQEELRAKQEEDRLFWEEERMKGVEKRRERSIMDDFLCHQILEQRFRRYLLRKEQLDFERKNEELVAEEEEQFRQYTDAVIDATSKANRNIIPLLRAAKQGVGCGLGPINGGFRSSFLVPGAENDVIPDYVRTTSENIQRVYTDTERLSDQERLGFIW